ncbi:hypothetical protein Pelo_1874 [Pelomyxa schiedti]|nr:hypothetical protein Pelo_1874 [Pelomyxa schiedti]
MSHQDLFPSRPDDPFATPTIKSLPSTPQKPTTTGPQSATPKKDYRSLFQEGLATAPTINVPLQRTTAATYGASSSFVSAVPPGFSTQQIQQQQMQQAVNPFGGMFGQPQAQAQFQFPQGQIQGQLGGGGFGVSVGMTPSPFDASGSGGLFGPSAAIMGSPSISGPMNTGVWPPQTQALNPQQPTIPFQAATTPQLVSLQATQMVPQGNPLLTSAKSSSSPNLQFMASGSPVQTQGNSLTLLGSNNNTQATGALSLLGSTGMSAQSNTSWQGGSTFQSHILQQPTSGQLTQTNPPQAPGLFGVGTSLSSTNLKQGESAVPRPTLSPAVIQPQMVAQTQMSFPQSSAQLTIQPQAPQMQAIGPAMNTNNPWANSGTSQSLFPAPENPLPARLDAATTPNPFRVPPKPISSEVRSSNTKNPFLCQIQSSPLQTPKVSVPGVSNIFTDNIPLSLPTASIPTMQTQPPNNTNNWTSSNGNLSLETPNPFKATSSPIATFPQTETPNPFKVTSSPITLPPISPLNPFQSNIASTVTQTPAVIPSLLSSTPVVCVEKVSHPNPQQPTIPAKPLPSAPNPFRDSSSVPSPSLSVSVLGVSNVFLDSIPVNIQQSGYKGTVSQGNVVTGVRSEPQIAPRLPQETTFEKPLPQSLITELQKQQLVKPQHAAVPLPMPKPPPVLPEPTREESKPATNLTNPVPPQKSTSLWPAAKPQPQLPPQPPVPPPKSLWPASSSTTSAQSTMELLFTSPAQPAVANSSLKSSQSSFGAGVSVFGDSTISKPIPLSTTVEPMEQGTESDSPPPLAAISSTIPLQQPTVPPKPRPTADTSLWSTFDTTTSMFSTTSSFTTVPTLNLSAATKPQNEVDLFSTSKTAPKFNFESLLFESEPPVHKPLPLRPPPSSPSSLAPTLPSPKSNSSAFVDFDISVQPVQLSPTSNAGRGSSSDLASPSLLLQPATVSATKGPQLPSLTLPPIPTTHVLPPAHTLPPTPAHSLPPTPTHSLPPTPHPTPAQSLPPAPVHTLPPTPIQIPPSPTRPPPPPMGPKPPILATMAPPSNSLFKEIGSIAEEEDAPPPLPPKKATVQLSYANSSNYCSFFRLKYPQT